MDKDGLSSHSAEDIGKLRSENLHLRQLVGECRESEKKALRSARGWSKAFDSITDLVSVHDRDFRIVRVNRAFSDFVGRPARELVGKRCYEIMHGGREPIEGCPHARSMEIGATAVREIHNPGNSTCWMVTCSPLCDEEGKPIGSVHVAKDITQRREVEEALRESESKLRETQRIAHLGYWELDLVKGDLYWSNEVYRIFGLEPQEFGATYEAFLELVYPDDRDLIEAAYTASLKNRTGYDMEHRLLLKNGDVKYVHERCNTKYDDRGNPVRSIGTVQDITDRKKAEEKLKEEAEISNSLLDIVETLNTSLDESELIRKVTNLAPRYLKFDKVGIFFYNEDLLSFTYAGGYGLTSPEEGLLLSKAFGAADFPMSGLTKGEAIIMESVLDSELMGTGLADALNVKSAVMIPISFKGRVMGVLQGGYKSRKAIKTKDISLLRGLADGLGIALQNSRLYRESIKRLMEASRNVETIKTMALLDKEILSAIDRDAILGTATALINRLVPCERAAVILKKGDTCTIASEWGLGGFKNRTYHKKELHTEMIEERRCPLFIPDISLDETGSLYHKELGALGIKSSLIVPLISKNEVIGFLDVGSVHPGRFAADCLTTTENIASQIAVALEHARLYEELAQLLISTTTSLASAIEAKSTWTKGHSEGVTQYAVEIGRELGVEGEDLKRLSLAGLLHDIGKIGTYDVLLDKVGSLSDEEFEAVKKHPGKGTEILLPIRQLREVLPAIRHHHETYDGRGYPAGLKGEEIPLHARILCVADAFEAMMADRPYRPSPGYEYALSELERCRGTQFDPVVVEAFLRIQERKRMV